MYDTEFQRLSGSRGGDGAVVARPLGDATPLPSILCRIDTYL
jgi:hypothetical protein